MTPTIDELLDSIENEGENTEEIFIKDAGYKEVPYSDAYTVVISNKSIGDLSGQISVAGEDNSQYIMFECERYMDGIDLTTKLVQIHYERPDGVGDNSPVANVEYSDLHIRFGWVVPAKAVAVSGRLKIMPFFSGTSPENRTYILKEQYAEYTVHNGLATDGGIEEPAEESWYQQFLSDILYLQQHTGAAEEAAERAAAAAQAASTDRAEVTELKTRTVEAAEKALQSARNAKASEEAAQKSATEAGAAKETVLRAREEITADRDQIDLNRRNILKTAVKRTASGRTIPIQDSAEMPFAGMRQYGHSRQQTTTGAQLIPFPYFCGMEKTTNGITFTVDGNGAVTIDGTAGEAAYFYFNPTETKISLPEGALTINNSSEFGENKPYLQAEIYSDGVYAGAVQTRTEKSATSTFSGKLELGACRIVVPKGFRAEKYKIYPMLNSGPSALPWEPYTGGKPSPSPEYPQEIASAGDRGIVETRVTGGNLIDYEKWKKLLVHRGTGEYRDNGIIITSGENGDAYTGYNGSNALRVPVSAGEVYTLSWEWSGATGSVFVFKNGLDEGNIHLAASAKKLTFTAEDGVEFITFRIGVREANTTAVYKNIMLNMGDTALPWEPYKKQSLTISTPNGLPGIPVSSDGNYTDETGQQWICDEVDFARGVYVQRVKNVVFDGSTDEKWFFQSINSHGIANFGIHVNTLNYYCLSDKFNRTSDVITNAKAPGILIGGNVTLYIRLESEIVSNLEEFAEWLSQNPTTVYYCVPTPIETPISADELAAYHVLHTNYPTTVITSDDVWTEAEYARRTEEVIGEKVQEGNIMTDTVTEKKYVLRMKGGLLTVFEVMV